jgi:hypothetical protein
MNTTTQQEILLMTGTSFTSRQTCENAADDNGQYLSEIEQLEDACCNGLLPEILPEICEAHQTDNLFLWQIKENKSCLGIELGEYPEIMEKTYCIDPYSFIELLSMN